MSPVSPPKPPPSSSQVLARLLGEDAGGGAGGRPHRDRRVGLGVLGFIVLTLVLLTVSVWPLIRLRMEPPRTVAEAKPDDPILKKFGESLEKDLAQFDGRSLFAIPGPPSPKRETAKKSTTPTRYGGPAIVAMINDQVWFSDGKRLGPSDAAAGGLKVVSINAPWSTKLEWEGAEFDVEFIQRSPLLALSEPSKSDAKVTPNPRSLGDFASPPPPVRSDQKPAAARPSAPPTPNTSPNEAPPASEPPHNPQPAEPESPAASPPAQVAPPPATPPTNPPAEPDPESRKS